MEMITMNYCKTPDQVRAEFKASGLSITAWAKAYGYPVASVYQVLKGDKQCCRGISHEIAVKLGLKEGRLGDDSEALTRRLMVDQKAAELASVGD
ncbi:DNA-binding protein [Chromobacterium haemolyticum]|uniref:DNA-binding protein n=1 Tax=Chromobacterium haemolyticum TaxID=394935 RepID=UPI001F2EA6BE|nr:DNA-binding protein [Chromobacterium haemolyticum]